MTEQIVLPGDCLEVLARLPAESVDAAVTDPPYGLSAEPDMRALLDAWMAGEHIQYAKNGFMNRVWDATVPPPHYWRALHRVLKPGAIAVVFAGTRTQDLMSLALTLGGLEVVDTFAWTYGSGFPKSLDVSKAIDKAKPDFRERLLQITAWIRSARDAAGLTNQQIDDVFNKNGMAGHWTSTKAQPYCPTPEQFPVLCRLLNAAPPAEVFALFQDQWEQTGQPGPAWLARPVTGQYTKAAPGRGMALGQTGGAGMTTAEIDAATATTKRDIPTLEAAAKWKGFGTALKPAYEPAIVCWKPAPGLARPTLPAAPFFYSAKVSRKERDHGCESLPEKSGGEATGREDGQDGLNSPRAGAGRGGGVRNHHPTVKPIALMRRLVRFAAAPGAVVIDPFCGSGSTGAAAALEGRSFVGIEREDGEDDRADYVSIARLRIAAAEGLRKVTE